MKTGILQVLRNAVLNYLIKEAICLQFSTDLYNFVAIQRPTLV